jgi:hypothetical protein
MMQKIKLLLIGFLGLILLFTIIGLIMPSSVKISRGLIVNADSAKVVNVISDVHRWPEWMNWLSAGDGSVIKWNNQKSPTSLQWQSLNQEELGEISVMGRAQDLLKLRHRFPGLNVAEGGIRVRSVHDGQAEILWMVEYPLKWYPWERFEGIFMDAMIGQSLEQSLKLLEEKLRVVSMEDV